MLTLKRFRTRQHVSILIDHTGTNELPDDDLIRSKYVGMFSSVLKLTFQTNILLY